MPCESVEYSGVGITLPEKRKLMVTHRQLQEAKEYLEQAIKQYNLDEVYINSLSDEEYVALAKKMQSEDKEHEWNG